MNMLKAIIFSLAGFAANAQSAEIISTNSMACTKDINLWGHASRCACPVSSLYDPRLGACVIGTYEPIMVSGQILAGLGAIGGETTGIALRTFENPEISYELVLNKVDSKKLSQLNGLPFEVEGDFINLPGVEIPSRPAIIVRELRWLD
ncbi:MAG TPA: hypothetical protein VE954_12260 [Oligoflexus sp.]|uniref:hypothetical protein n=1 Tax=Oligoflexus sp. TaxID=1971216 RepID=UPI002D620FB3|nr:hypothetical protein [Oligoflexus sp.]HYX33880.1 hypothetical protein [Oligoflexus sp.]